MSWVARIDPESSVNSQSAVLWQAGLLARLCHQIVNQLKPFSVALYTFPISKLLPRKEAGMISENGFSIPEPAIKSHVCTVLCQNLLLLNFDAEVKV